jgi:hypothetical protein
MRHAGRFALCFLPLRQRKRNRIQLFAFGWEEKAAVFDGLCARSAVSSGRPNASISLSAFSAAPLPCSLLLRRQLPQVDGPADLDGWHAGVGLAQHTILCPLLLLATYSCPAHRLHVLLRDMHGHGVFDLCISI